MKEKALTKLMGNVDWKWAEEQELAFTSLKNSAPVLALATDDGKFIVEADTSGTGIGGILSQKHLHLQWNRMEL